MYTNAAAKNLTVKSLQYARVNRNQKQKMRSLENSLSNSEKVTNKEIIKTSEISEKWTDLVSRDLSLEEILDLEADKEV